MSRLDFSAASAFTSASSAARLASAACLASSEDFSSEPVSRSRGAAAGWGSGGIASGSGSAGSTAWAPPPGSTASARPLRLVAFGLGLNNLRLDRSGLGGLGLDVPCIHPFLFGFRYRCPCFHTATRRRFRACRRRRGSSGTGWKIVSIFLESGRAPARRRVGVVDRVSRVCARTRTTYHRGGVHLVVRGVSRRSRVLVVVLELQRHLWHARILVPRLGAHGTGRGERDEHRKRERESQHPTHGRRVSHDARTRRDRPGTGPTSSRDPQSGCRRRRTERDDLRGPALSSRQKIFAVPPPARVLRINVKTVSRRRLSTATTSPARPVLVLVDADIPHVAPGRDHGVVVQTHQVRHEQPVLENAPNTEPWRLPGSTAARGGS